MFVESTWEAILGEIARLPLEKAHVLFGRIVSKISTAGRESEGDKVILRTDRSGEYLKVDEVVMTTPLGWLKQNKSCFSPPLPERVLSGIDGVSLSHLEKVCAAESNRAKC